MSVFAIRNIEFITNVLEAQYVMSNKMSAKIKFRHHWEQVKNHSFHGLNSEGFLTSSNYLGNTMLISMLGTLTLPIVGGLLLGVN